MPEGFKQLRQHKEEEFSTGFQRKRACLEEEGESGALVIVKEVEGMLRIGLEVESTVGREIRGKVQLMQGIDCDSYVLMQHQVRGEERHLPNFKCTVSVHTVSHLLHHGLNSPNVSDRLVPVMGVSHSLLLITLLYELALLFYVLQGSHFLGRVFQQVSLLIDILSQAVYPRFHTHEVRLEFLLFYLLLLVASVQTDQFLFGEVQSLPLLNSRPTVLQILQVGMHSVFQVK